MFTAREPLEDGEVVATHTHSTAEAPGGARGIDPENIVYDDASTLLNLPASGSDFPTVHGAKGLLSSCGYGR